MCRRQALRRARCSRATPRDRRGSSRRRTRRGGARRRGARRSRSRASLAGRRPARARCSWDRCRDRGVRRLRTPTTSAIAAAPTATAVHARSHAAEMVTPMITTSMTSSGAPPTRTTNAIGETAWLIANDASGTPPNGHDHLRISASTIEPGSTTHRQRLAGAIAQATPNQTEEISGSDDPTRRREEHHPPHAGEEPRRGDRPSAPEPAARRLAGEKAVEEDDAHDQQRPPSPRRKRERHERARAEARRDRDEARWDACARARRIPRRGLGVDHQTVVELT